MPIVDKNRIYDGWLSMEGGVDAGRDILLLDPNQSAQSQNMVFRGGLPTTRPGFRKLTERFNNPNHCYTLHGDNTSEHIQGQEANTIYKNGIFQGAIAYSAHGGEDSIMAMIGGRLYKIIPGVKTC